MKAQHPSLPSAFATTGDLRVTAFAELLVALLDAQKTGALQIADQHGELHASIRFESGLPVAACVLCPENGLMQSLIPLCARSEGSYVFAENCELAPSAEIVTGEVDPLALIAAAMRGPVREDAINRALALLGTSPLRLNPRVELERYRFTPQEHAVIAMLWNAPIDVLQLQGRTEVAPHLLRRLLYVLAITRGITALPAAHRPTSGTIVHAPPLPGPDLRADPRARRELPTEQIPLDGPFIAQQTAPVRAPRSATVLEHPTRSAQKVVVPAQSAPEAAPQSAPQPVRPTADGARARKSRLLQREASSDQRAAASYHVRNPELGRTELPPGAVNLGLPRDLPPVLQLWCGEILERARLISRQNYYELLGLQRDCREDQIDAARAAIGKHFDPDQLPEELASVRDRAQAIVDQVTHAAETLCDPERRRRYDRDLDAGSSLGMRPAVQRGLTAEAHYRKSEALLKRKDYGGALHEAERALSIGGACARYEAIYGYLLYLRGAAGDNVDPRAIELLARALKRDPRSVQANYYMAVMLKHSGDAERAHQHFTRVLELQPGHIEAAREVRLFETRKRERRSPSGLLDRLLGRSGPVKEQRAPKRSNRSGSGDDER
jgi:curved DNA-binding protein CbpA